jgi:septal ring factor EnvC (AmiA/AmiB activator)
MERINIIEEEKIGKVKEDGWYFLGSAAWREHHHHDRIFILDLGGRIQRHHALTIYLSYLSQERLEHIRSLEKLYGLNAVI